MNHHGFRALAVCAALAPFATGCTQAPDLSAARAEAQKPVQRYDAIQALAAHGEKVAAGTRSGAVLVSSDGGRSWTRQPIAGPSSITGMYFSDAERAANDCFTPCCSRSKSAVLVLDL